MGFCFGGLIVSGGCPFNICSWGGVGVVCHVVVWGWSSLLVGVCGLFDVSIIVDWWFMLGVVSSSL